MKEKMSLLLGLSLLICLTVYKKSFSDNIELSNNTSISEDFMSLDQKNNDEKSKDQMTINNIAESETQCGQDEESINQLSFNDAFKYHRDCNHNVFKWNGSEYTTILKIDSSEDVRDVKKTRKIDLVAN